MKLISLVFFAVLIVFIACEDQKIVEGTDINSRVDMTVFGLNAPGDTAWYESWILWNALMGQGTDIQWESLGILNRAGDGSYHLETEIDLGYLQSGVTILVTIEDDDSVANEPPSSYRIIAAQIEANAGSFSLGNEEILDFAFEGAQGRFILDSPSAAPGSENPFSGIWFVNPDTTIDDILDDDGNIVDRDTTIEFLPGLDLPDLPDDWVYEGFVVVNGETLSVGTFSKSEGPDESSPYSGPGTGYDFPGEDFLTNPPPGLTFPLDLRGALTYITLTPATPEYSAVPYVVTVYETQIPTDAQANQRNFLQNLSGSFPAGSLRIDVDIYK